MILMFKEEIGIISIIDPTYSWTIPVAHIHNKPRGLYMSTNEDIGLKLSLLYEITTEMLALGYDEKLLDIIGYYDLSD